MNKQKARRDERMKRGTADLGRETSSQEAEFAKGAEWGFIERQPGRLSGRIFPAPRGRLA